MDEMGRGFREARSFNLWWFGIVYELNMGLNDRTRFNEGIILTLPRTVELKWFCQGYGIKV